jgi:hypothetical protein
MRRGLVAVMLAVALLASPASAEVIDKVLAVISGQILMKSDVEAALALGLVEPKPGADRVSGALDALIDRVLMLNEVRRVVPPEPSAASIDARLARIRARFESPAALSRVLDASGIDETVLRMYAADDLRLTSYIGERFSGAAQPTDEEIRQAGESARQRLFSERQQTLVGAWVAELRRRADLTVMP